MAFHRTPKNVCLPGLYVQVDILDELLELLKRLLDTCLCVLTCGCYRRRHNSANMPMYETELMEEEREAVQDLLNYLDSGKCRTYLIN